MSSRLWRAACPDPVALSRARESGADGGLLAHLSTCGKCMRAWDGEERLVRLAREIPWTPPGVAASEEARTALLAKTQFLARARGQHRPGQGSLLTHRQASHLVHGSLALLAATVLLLVGLAGVELVRKGRHDELRGTVAAVGKARFSHQGPARDEVVRLAEGTIRVAVAPLRGGERFRVLVGQDEVEVRGTSFEVTAAASALSRVFVAHGRVEVRPVHGRPVVLGAGEGWGPTVEDEAERKGPKEMPGPPSSEGPGAPAKGSAGSTGLAGFPMLRGPADGPLAGAYALGRTTSLGRRGTGDGKGWGRPRLAVLPQDPAGLAFDEGWGALRAGRYVAAAESFGLAYEKANDPATRGKSPLSEDAAYWRGVSLARAGRSSEAVAEMRGFLARYPRSPRVGEAASILGWLVFDREARSAAVNDQAVQPGARPGDLDEAEGCFRRALRDRSARVQQSARDGLSALADRRGRPGRPPTTSLPPTGP